MSELAFTVGVVVLPIIWRKYQSHKAQKERTRLLAELERRQAEEQHAQAAPRLPPNPSSLLPNTGQPIPHQGMPNDASGLPGKQQLTPTLRFILGCLVVHQVFIAWKVYAQRPPNIFNALNLPVTTLVSRIRRDLATSLGQYQ